MKPWKTLERAVAPGGGELVLAERDGQFVIRVDGKELMSSRRHGSEEAMAGAALTSRRTAAARVLVGGLGMGFTLRTVLDLLPAGARVVVAELSEAVVRWNREPLAALAQRPLEDPRVEVRVADVQALLASQEGTWDAVLLDVDNGPSALSAPTNARLYGDKGIARCRDGLRPGGRLVVWSASPDTAYLARLRRAGLEASMQQVKAHGRGAAFHTLFVAARL